jgi:hypothetical protein
MKKTKRASHLKRNGVSPAMVIAGAAVAAGVAYLLLRKSSGKTALPPAAGPSAAPVQPAPASASPASTPGQPAPTLASAEQRYAEATKLMFALDDAMMNAIPLLKFGAKVQYTWAENGALSSCSLLKGTANVTPQLISESFAKAHQKLTQQDKMSLAISAGAEPTSISSVLQQT